MQYRRHYEPGSRYFFTVVTEKRRPLLIKNINRLREAFELCKLRYPFEIEAIIVLPDHLHTIWKLPEGDSNYSKRWMIIKRKFSSGFKAPERNKSQIQKREKGIWQRRFWEHYIRSEEDWRNHIDYIHFNAVKHGYVEKPYQWKYSSYKKSIEKGWYLPNMLNSLSSQELETAGE